MCDAEVRRPTGCAVVGGQRDILQTSIRVVNEVLDFRSVFVFVACSEGQSPEVH
jgi:hypothetical protein